LEIKEIKENSVQWTDWDINRECLKFDKVGKHSSSTKIITVNDYYQCIVSGKCTASNSHKNTSHYCTVAYQILWRPNQFYHWD